MNSGETTYVWQQDAWPHWRYDATQLMPLLAQVHHALGRVLGRMQDQGHLVQDKATLVALTDDVLKTSEIEGELLNAESVRSSIAHRLGVDIGALLPTDRQVEGVVDMVLDATGMAHQALTVERLATWHAALFPTGYSGLSPLRVGQWRDDKDGPMQVVSGPMHRRKVHFQAPPAHRLEHEVATFLQWLEHSHNDDPLIKAGLAHLWFVTIHPFDDGNGRIARAIGDLALARADQSAQRFYSLSAQIQKERKDYYALLEKTQKGALDATDWLTWFLGCLLRALQGADAAISKVLEKANFWREWAGTPLNARQIKILNRMLDGSDGHVTNKKWATMAKCSADSALRDINDLIAKGILRPGASAGRSTWYEMSTLNT